MIKKITVAIPIYNEINNLKILIPELIAQIKLINNNFEIILVNDCSTDDSLKFCNSLVKNDSNYEIKVLNLKKKSGQSGAFKNAFKIATGEYIIKMDADLQDHPKNLKHFIKKINENYDVIVGDRVKRKHNFFLFLAGKIFDVIIRLIFHTPVQTNHGSFAAYKAKYVKNFPWHKNDHRYLTLIALQKGAKNLCNISVTHRKRIYGVSNYNTFTKLLLGTIEITFFIIRVLSGKYK